jgi:hypothetical protein
MNLKPGHNLGTVKCTLITYSYFKEIKGFEIKESIA